MRLFHIWFLLVLTRFESSVSLPDLAEGKVSDLKFSSDSKGSGYDKSHGTHKEADSNGWKNLKSSDKGKLEKGKQDEEMYHGEGESKSGKKSGFHKESGGHKSKDKGLNKNWNRGDGTMKTWNWNKGGHLEEEEGGKWRTEVHHRGKKGKKMGSSKEKVGDEGGSHYESTKKKEGSKKKSVEKMQKSKKKEKASHKYKSDSGKSESNMDEKIEKMKFDQYEKPMMDGWSDGKVKAKSSFHPSGYKGVDHGSRHGGRLAATQNHHSKTEFAIEKETKKNVNSLEGDEFGSEDSHLPEELRSMDDLDKELGD